MITPSHLSKMLEKASQLGEKGWELATVSMIDIGVGEVKSILYFKRELKPRKKK